MCVCVSAQQQSFQKQSKHTTRRLQQLLLITMILTAVQALSRFHPENVKRNMWIECMRIIINELINNELMKRAASSVSFGDLYCFMYICNLSHQGHCTASSLPFLLGRSNCTLYIYKLIYIYTVYPACIYADKMVSLLCHGGVGYGNYLHGWCALAPLTRNRHCRSIQSCSDESPFTYDETFPS